MGYAAFESGFLFLVRLREAGQLFSTFDEFAMASASRHLSFIMLDRLCTRRLASRLSASTRSVQQADLDSMNSAIFLLLTSGLN